MEAQKKVLTQSSLDDQLRKLRWLVVELPGWLEEGRDDLQTDNSEAIVTAYQWAFRQTKQGEEQLQRYEGELEKILAILSKDKMRRYCELRAREIREGVSSGVSGELAKLCHGLDRAEKQAQLKIHQLLEIIHECETALSLYRNHLRWVETVAWDRGVSLLREDRPEPQVVSDPEEKISQDTDEPEISGKVATKIGKNHNYPDKDITAVCIAVACEKDGITDRMEIARKLKRGARNHYKGNNRSRFIDRDWLRTEKGKTGFSSHVHRLREKAKKPKYKTSVGTTMADSIRKDYKLPQK